MALVTVDVEGLTLLRWTRELPTKPGIYLRRNPPVQFVVRQDIFLIAGELCAGTHEGMIKLHRWVGAARFQWFGPIPQPPMTEDD